MKVDQVAVAGDNTRPAGALAFGTDRRAADRVCC
jgi:hypothetical protein